MSNQADFHLEEYKSLRHEIDVELREITTSVQHALLASAAVISWLATTSSARVNPLLYNLAWWLPFILCGFGSLRALGIITRITLMSQYLRRIEERLSYKEIGGWEHFINQHRRHTMLGMTSSVISYLAWIVLVIGSFLIGLIAQYSPAVGPT